MKWRGRWTNRRYSSTHSAPAATAGPPRSSWTTRASRYDFVYVDLLSRDELRKVLDEVAKVNPQRSFPTILIGDKVIVGNREAEILEALGL